MNLSGLRTKLWGIAAAIPTMVATTAGQVSPELITSFIEGHPIVVMAYQAATALGVWHYREQADIDNHGTALKPQTELEELLSQEIESDYEHE